jgi:hypothetical protein
LTHFAFLSFIVFFLMNHCSQKFFSSWNSQSNTPTFHHHHFFSPLIPRWTKRRLFYIFSSE